MTRIAVVSATTGGLRAADIAARSGEVADAQPCDAVLLVSGGCL